MAGISKGLRRRLRWILWLGLLAATLEFPAFPALAGDCPGNPNALGTSRTLVVDPREHPRIGTMQYQETLPLRDHEVVLTFDDGPLPPHSLQVLDILAHECVKATFFTVGRMARDYPQYLRRVLAAGHSIGTHSQNHLLSMNRMPIERARQEIDDGIASAAVALGDPAAVAPFMRIPGLLRAKGVEDYLASNGIQLWSADFPADDWRHVSAERVYQLAISRIEAKGKGILLLHDIQARTVAALPRILRTLKERGYRIVHVVPTMPNRPKTATEPQNWRMHSAPATVAIPHAPEVPAFSFADAGALPAPAISSSRLNQGQLLLLPEVFDRSQRFVREAVPLLQGKAAWPPQSTAAIDNVTGRFPLPARNFFAIQEKPAVPLRAALPLPQQIQPADGTRHSIDDNLQSISIDASAAKRAIPGSQPALRPAFH
ncbi:polysaccharide deacetylase [Nitrobacter sp. Nb-311A]|uniref:polysaccharide deacetylase family protein n=1 Tax=unclassified Nitrobacter TaxID=2620411 RepID=UPI00006873B9|nr:MULTISPECIES: polysaccharide deacetylase family protein [unclassified Nitrobacter]EAQ35536.1 polysaccharide deacetylase [Nitrobacter sp. Nb-311A]MCB1392605.1 polysaccharide deacetylase family protein [Nitrobacter sp.]MCV0385937.1 polysaccharide deacetylase family protein [Nitrobacter sp.]